jgi:hypothetical protein
MMEIQRLKYIYLNFAIHTYINILCRNTDMNQGRWYFKMYGGKPKEQKKHKTEGI